jgi:hypothetical protein
VALPATWEHKNKNNSNPVVAIKNFLPIEDVKNLTNHISTPSVKIYELMYFFEWIDNIKKIKKRKRKLGFFL